MLPRPLPRLHRTAAAVVDVVAVADAISGAVTDVSVLFIFCKVPFNLNVF